VNYREAKAPQLPCFSSCNIANSIHFDTSWANKLSSFIGNYILDDAAFDFEQEDGRPFNFKPSGDDGRWLQNPKILVEAAKANREYYDKMEKRVLFDADGNLMPYGLLYFN